VTRRAHIALLGVALLCAGRVAAQDATPPAATPQATTPPAAVPPALPTTAPTAVPAGRVLSLAQALKIAASRQPSLRRARAQTAAARARAEQAEAPLWPQVTGSASYQRTTRNSSGSDPSGFASVPGAIPGVTANRGGSDFDTFNRFNFGLNATQLVYDFGRTSGRSEAADESFEAQRASEVLSQQQVTQAVRAAFFSARAAKTMLAVAAETLANVERHVAQIDAFVRAGARAEIDLLELRTDRANARVELISAENTYATAKAQLNQAIGEDGGGDYDVADDGMPPIDGEDDGLEALYARAQRARPELRVLARQLRAQQLTIDATRGGYWPSLSVGTGLSETGSELDDMAWNWNAGATLTWPLYQGGLTVAQVDEARAQLNSLHADVDAQRQRIRLEVEQARLDVRAAKATLGASDEAVVSARERLRLAEGRYTAGAGSALELSDAQLAFANAQAQRVRADYTLASARAGLLLALGE
jgi:outer membrane protein